MVCFPNAKINIGLNVLAKRDDGYHDIESLFYPVSWCDTLEVMRAEGDGEIKLSLLGNPIPGSAETNLCYKAYTLLDKEYKLPSVNVWLLKTIPTGAGLGGGSADAAFLLKLLNQLFQLKLGEKELRFFASQIGSDCSFFIENRPSVVTGKGDIITPVNIDLSKYYITIVYPPIHVDTKNAYSHITPSEREYSLKDIVTSSPISSWKDAIVNDFEEPIFNIHPHLAEIKRQLYDEGALYASMTGSGAALYAIFEEKPNLAVKFPSCKVWITNPVN